MDLPIFGSEDVPKEIDTAKRSKAVCARLCVALGDGNPRWTSVDVVAETLICLADRFIGFVCLVVMYSL